MIAVSVGLGNALRNETSNWSPSAGWVSSSLVEFVRAANEINQVYDNTKGLTLRLQRPTNSQGLVPYRNLLAVASPV